MVLRGKSVVRFGQNVSEMSQKFIALFTAEFASSFSKTTRLYTLITICVNERFVFYNVKDPVLLRGPS